MKAINLLHLLLQNYIMTIIHSFNILLPIHRNENLAKHKSRWLLVHDLFGQVTATSFTEDGALCMKLHPALEVVLGCPILTNANVICCNSLHTAILMEENF